MRVLQASYLSVRPILEASYSTAQYTGGLGTAMIPKVLSNMLCGLQVMDILVEKGGAVKVKP